MKFRLNSRKPVLKTVLAVLLLLTIANATRAQAPESINYQAALRDTADELIRNQNVGIKFQIREDAPLGTIVYTEQHTVTTDNYGLINLGIGEGSSVTGSFSTIDWANETYYLEVMLDETGGTGFISLGSSKFRGHSNSLC